MKFLNDFLTVNSDILPTLKWYLNIISTILYRSFIGFVFILLTLLLFLIFWFLSVSGSDGSASRIRVRYASNRLQEFYLLCPPWKKEFVNTYMVSSFFKCRQNSISGFLVEYLLDVYQNKGIFILDETKVKFGWRDMILISGLNIASHAMRETSVQVSSFKDRYFVGIKQVATKRSTSLSLEQNS